MKRIRHTLRLWLNRLRDKRHARRVGRSLQPCPLDFQSDWMMTSTDPARVAVNLLIYHAWKSGQTEWSFSPQGADLDFPRLREEPPCQTCDTTVGLGDRLPALWPDIQLRFRQILGGGPAGELLPADVPHEGRLELLLTGRPVNVLVSYAPDRIRLRLGAATPAASGANP